MPTDTVKKVDYWHVVIPDRPGEAGTVLQKLAGAKVNLLASLAFPNGAGKTQLDLVPVEAAAFEKAAKSAGLALSPKKRALLVQGGDRVGALAQHMKRLGDAKINCTAYAAVTASAGGYGFLVWVKQEQVDAAAAALGA